MSELQQLNIANLKVNNTIISGGQPSEQDLRQLRKMGCELVVNLRPPQEMVGNDEASLVQSLEMDYLQIPVANPNDFRLENAKKLQQAIEKVDGGVFVHCLSGNRVGVLMALIAYHIEDKDIENSIQKGRDFGLTNAEPMVRQLLAQS